MIKRIILVITLLSLAACGGKNYKVKNYKNEIPKWYVEDKKIGKKVFGKAIGQSEFLELASRKAEGLAVSNVLLKLKSEANVIKNIYVAEFY